MKKIGLIGGMSWEATQTYYRIINSEIREKLGGFHSAKCSIESLDFYGIEKLQQAQDWQDLSHRLVKASKALESAGADMIVLCADSVHICSDAIESNTSIPFLHIADATGEKIKENNINKVLLLGAKYTMKKDFIKKILAEKYGIEVVIPSAEDIKVVHDIIYDELVCGIFKPSSEDKVQEIINKAIENEGIQGVVLGASELPAIIKQDYTNTKIFDTISIHAEKAVEYSLVD